MILRAAPDENAALPVRNCSPDEPLDAIIPFSSLILLGVVVAVEDRYGIRITRDQLARACESGANLRHLANMIEEALTEKFLDEGFSRKGAKAQRRNSTPAT